MNATQIAILENGTAAIIPDTLMYLVNEGDRVTTYNNPSIVNKVFLIQTIYAYKSQSDASFLSLLLRRKIEPENVITELKEAVRDKKIDIVYGLLRVTEQINIDKILDWINTKEDKSDEA